MTLIIFSAGPVHSFSARFILHWIQGPSDGDCFAENRWAKTCAGSTHPD